MKLKPACSGEYRRLSGSFLGGEQARNIPLPRTALSKRPSEAAPSLPIHDLHRAARAMAGSKRESVQGTVPNTPRRFTSPAMEPIEYTST